MIVSKSLVMVVSLVLVFALLPDQRPNLYVALIGALTLDLIQKLK
jgi:hypothetical protein